ncbi:cation-translocating P-type ATPase [Corynebacterium sp.]|uniref:heavy metal translocating P-type ATPase n=1 Tax=Corynebacterium sp. TaxID=1720 RepID=UPI0028A66F16|nr:cation-translocating P-type ATPase [Corynebacterium sp.]
MSTACGCHTDVPVTGTAAPAPEQNRPWWRDGGVLVPVLSGAALTAGLVTDRSGADVAASALFWTALLLGASTFTPGAVRALVRGRLGIGLLMTVSAVGAVALGYVGEAAALAFLYSIAEALEDRAMDRARRGLRSLLQLVPQTATVRRNGATVEIAAADLTTGELMLVRPGDRVATDGVVRSGHSGLDTSAVTGESIPVDVGPGDTVAAGAVNTTGVLEVETTAAGTDNSLTMMVGLVEQAQAEKGERARLADRIARPLVPGVLVLAVAVALAGSLLGDPGVWVTRALVVLVAASPCALAISVPLTVVAAIGAASRFGVVVKSGAAFERLGTVRHVAVDKTGTLTRNEPTVAAVVTTGSVDADRALQWAAALEQHSSHPLATAIAAAAPHAPAATGVTERAGQGVHGDLDGESLTIGSPRWLHTGPLAAQVADLEQEGMTVVVLHRGGTPVAAVGIRDELRPEVPEVVHTLTGAGRGVTMLTGDNARTAAALATQAGIDDVRAELGPQDKAVALAGLSRAGTVAMIGDGINDAPALAAADVGIAMGATGADAAIESADIAFTGHDLRLIPRALDHARRGRRIINQNIVLSLLIITALVPMALSGVLGLAAVVLVHEVAEVVVILNGLRAARTGQSAQSDDGGGGM